MIWTKKEERKEKEKKNSQKNWFPSENGKKWQEKQRKAGASDKSIFFVHFKSWLKDTLLLYLLIVMFAVSFDISIFWDATQKFKWT